MTTYASPPDGAALMADYGEDVSPTLFESDVTGKAYDLRVLEAAREQVRAEAAADVPLAPLVRLDDFLAVPDVPVTHRMAGLWPSGGRVVLSAANKAGKTTMIGNLLRSLADGERLRVHYPTNARSTRSVSPVGDDPPPSDRT